MLQTACWGLKPKSNISRFLDLQPVSAPSLPGNIELGSRLPWLPSVTLGFLEFDHIHQ